MLDLGRQRGRAVGIQDRGRLAEAGRNSSGDHLHSSARTGSVVREHEGTATRIQSDHRGDWAGALTLVPGVRRSWFQAAKSLTEILDGVAEVALAASSGDGQGAVSLSKAQWDASRLQVGRSDLPTAQTIRQRLRLSWPRTLELALTDPNRRATLRGQWEGRGSGSLGAGGRELAKASLAAVALDLGHIPTAAEYDSAVRRKESSRRRRKGGKAGESGRASLEATSALRLPSSSFVVSDFGRWSSAVEASGAEAGALPRQPRIIPPAEDTLDNFIEEYGILPAMSYFVEWCRRCDIPLPDDKQFSEVVTEVWKRRYLRGASMPQAPTRFKKCPPLPPQQPRVRRMRHRVTEEEMVASLRRYGELYLSPDHLPRQKDYSAACRKNPELIWPNAIRKFGKTFQEMCRSAGI